MRRWSQWRQNSGRGFYWWQHSLPWPRLSIIFVPWFVSCVSATGGFSMLVCSWEQHSLMYAVCYCKLRSTEQGGRPHSKMCSTQSKANLVLADPSLASPKCKYNGIWVATLHRLGDKLNLKKGRGECHGRASRRLNGLDGMCQMGAGQAQDTDKRANQTEKNKPHATSSTSRSAPPQTLDLLPNLSSSTSHS